LFGFFQGKTEGVKFPAWGEAFAILLICLALIWVPLIAILRYFGLYRGQMFDSRFHHTTSTLELVKDEKPPLGTAGGDFDSKL
jgi:hypothetical protein